MTDQANKDGGVIDAINMCAAIANQIGFLEQMADVLDGWANQSKSGGWSTHQVNANEAYANTCRREAAKLRAMLRARTQREE